MPVDNYFRVIRRDGTGARMSFIEDTFAFASNNQDSARAAYNLALRRMAHCDSLHIAVAKPIPYYVDGPWPKQAPEWHAREEDEIIEETSVGDDGEPVTKRTVVRVDRGYWTGLPLIGQSPPYDMRAPSNQLGMPGVE